MTKELTREETIEELVEDWLEFSLNNGEDGLDNIRYDLKQGCKGYNNETNEELIEEWNNNIGELNDEHLKIVK